MDLPNRKPLRLKTYDYSLPGAYFVTLCTYKRQQLFHVEMICRRNGTQAVPYVGDKDAQTVGHDLCVVPNVIIHKWVREIGRKYGVRVDRYIIMPDHIHLLIFIEERHESPSPQEGCETERHIGRSLPEIMRWFKTMTTNEYIRHVKTGTLSPFRQKLWQKSYYDHIVRNDEDYEKTWQYIENNPTQFFIDQENKDKKRRNPFL